MKPKKTKSEQEIRKNLNFDPLAEAEKITGKNHREDKTTIDLGLLFHLFKSKENEQILTEMDDTHFNCNVVDYLAIAKNIGFKVIYSEKFETENGFDWQYILFHYDYYILLNFDTYSGYKNIPNINGGNFYYNWLMPLGNIPHCTSSGGVYHKKVNNQREVVYYDLDTTQPVTCPLEPEPHWDNKHMTYGDFRVLNDDWNKRLLAWAQDNNIGYLWQGQHDCREALRFNINQLVEHGKFLPWVEGPSMFLWLLNYSEEKSENYKEINLNKIRQFPSKVKELIGYGEI
jgi:hypothetical protein